MHYQKFIYTAKDSRKISCYKWLPEKSPLAVIQIIHGMAEHARRYDHFASYLNKKGYAVFSADLRGHGETAGNIASTGYFAEKNGWKLVIDDITGLSKCISSEFPDAPIFIFGHSMGAFLASSCITKYNYSGCILSGTTVHSKLLLSAGLLIARLQKFFKGKQNRSKLLDNMSFGTFNKRIKEPRTKFDWLSHDGRIVEKYVDDPYCGFVCTTGFFIDLFKGLKFINNKKYYSLINKDIPLFLYGGSEDPVGNYGKGLAKRYESYKKAGCVNVNLKIYNNKRHEMHNEINREEVYNDVFSWLNVQINNKISAENEH